MCTSRCLLYHVGAPNLPQMAQKLEREKRQRYAQSWCKRERERHYILSSHLGLIRCLTHIGTRLSHTHPNLLLALPYKYCTRYLFDSSTKQTMLILRAVLLSLLLLAQSQHPVLVPVLARSTLSTSTRSGSTYYRIRLQETRQTDYRRGTTASALQNNSAGCRCVQPSCIYCFLMAAQTIC